MNRTDLSLGKSRNLGDFRAGNVRPSYLGDIIDAVSEPIEGARRAQASPCQHNWRAIPWPVVEAVTRGCDGGDKSISRAEVRKGSTGEVIPMEKNPEFRNGPMLIGPCHVQPSLPTYAYSCKVGDSGVGGLQLLRHCATAPFRLQGGGTPCLSAEQYSSPPSCGAPVPFRVAACGSLPES